MSISFVAAHHPGHRRVISALGVNDRESPLGVIQASDTVVRSLCSAFRSIDNSIFLDPFSRMLVLYVRVNATATTS